MHDRNIVHADIKPANIMIKKTTSTDKKIRLAIGDFGISELVQSNMRIIKTCGTPSYMAPEVFSKDGHSYKADIFSAGSVMFNMISYCQLY